MEAKVLRAALSAAIRVTVSTSLLGCGGVTTGGQEEAPASTEPPANDSQGQGVTAPSPGYGNGYGYGSGGYPTSNAGSSPETAGSTNVAGTGAGGLAMGEGGAAQAGAPGAGTGGVPGQLDPCEAAQACVSDLQPLLTDGFPELPTTPRTTECCQLIISQIAPWGVPLQCGEATLNAGEELRWPCCQVLQSPMDTACTPWGPPVPPELDVELLGWAAA